MTESRRINKRIFGVSPEINSIDAFKKANIIIDFTVPKCTFEILKIAFKLNNDKVSQVIKQIKKAISG